MCSIHFKILYREKIFYPVCDDNLTLLKMSCKATAYKARETWGWNKYNIKKRVDIGRTLHTKWMGEIKHTTSTSDK